MPYPTRTAKAAANKRYRENHKEDLRQRRIPKREEENRRTKLWREAHRDRVREYNKANYAKLFQIVYRWTAPNGQTIYVGRGNNYRPKAHQQPSTRKTWWTPDLTLTVHRCHNEADSMRQEGIWIMKYKPTQNKEGYRR